MKTGLVLLGLAMTSFLTAQSVADDFYFAHKDRNTSVSLSIGNLLLTAGSWFVEDEGTKHLIRKSRRAQILFSDENNFVSQREIKYFISDLKQEGFESLARVRSKDSNLAIYLREDNRGNIRNIVALFNDTSEFGMVNLECKVRLSDLQCLYHDVSAIAHELRSNHSINIEF